MYVVEHVRGVSDDLSRAQSCIGHGVTAASDAYRRADAASPHCTVRARRLDGIAPNKTGIPQVVVTLQLDEAFKLRVTALDKQRNHSRSLVCKEVK